jgi:peptidoglycan/xylan/chitin deacetylase (PgdA/CDA1 family)
MNVRTDYTKPIPVKTSPIKKAIKRSLQHVAARFGQHTRTSKQPRLLVLMYHRILPADDPRAQCEEPGMMVTPETFRLHLELLKQYFSIVKLSDWLELKQQGKQLPASACAITFDDGWLDNYEFAFPILKELDIPATIFLVADMIGTKQQFWPERLASVMTAVATRYPQYWSHPELQWLQENPDLYQFNETPPNSEEISALIATLKDYTDQQMHEKLDRIESTLQLEDNSATTLLDWSQVDEMLASGLIDVGSHTCHHTRLNETTPPGQIRDEIVSSKQLIEEHTKRSVNTFCYPNGDHCPQAVELVRQNYNGAVTTKFGWNTLQNDDHLLQRIGVHQDISADKTAFLARLSGWM